MKWGLTDEQVKARAGGIGGSDAWTVVHGTPEERYDLWQVKIGQKRPKKIMSDWNAAWRHVTEGLQLDWYEHVHPDHKVVDRGASMVHRRHNWMRCTLDGRVVPLGVPVNAKMLSSWTKDARAWVIEKYTCSTTHEATVVGADYGLLSLIHGEKEPEIIEVEVDPFYQIEMLEREEAFWKCCVDRVPPEGCEELAVPKAAKLVPKLRTLDASETSVGSDEWRNLIASNNWLPDLYNHAAAFSETEGAFKAHQASRADISRLLPEDVGQIMLPVRRGVFLGKRNSAGAITMKTESHEKLD